MHDKYRKKNRLPAATERLRQQIALEAARRLLEAAGDVDLESGPLEWLDAARENDFYVAKRKAAAVLGHRVRPGDLPSDSEVRDQLVTLWRSRRAQGDPAEEPMPEPAESEEVVPLAERLDRFALYRMRLAPLEAVKQNPRFHPEGDALYHSLQVFHLAREVRPYDEEFLLAALLHDVGKAIDAYDHAQAGVEALRGAVTERTLWLIGHHMDLMVVRERGLSSRTRRELDASEFFDDLKLLRELDDGGRVPGTVVETLDAVLDYIKGIEREAYLDA